MSAGIQSEIQFRKKSKIPTLCGVTNTHPVPSQVLKVLRYTYVSTKEIPIWNELNAEVLTADELCGFYTPGNLRVEKWQETHVLLLACHSPSKMGNTDM